jgi:TP901 family phage tail tape measure protein
MPPQAKVGFLKLMIGATPVGDALRNDIQQSGQAMSDATKKLQSAQYAIISGALVGIAAVTFELIKAVQATAMFESAFAGIRKTVEASESQFEDLSRSILRMSTTIPVSAGELARIGELGGQLGISVQNLPEFISTVSTLATTTNLTVDNAALGLARLDAIAQTNGETFSNLASTIVDLGNNFAATESEIMTTVLRIAQAAAQVGATTQDALAFATALQAIGVPAQAGGTAVARVFQSIQSAIIQAGEDAEIFAKVASRSGKVSAEGFAQMFGEDPAYAAQLFIEGLGNMNEAGEDVITVLDKLGLSQRRTTLAILGLAEAEDLLDRAMNTSRDAHEANTAATEEAIKRYSTLESQLQITKNAFNELQVQIGENVAPAVKGFNDIIQETIIGLTNSGAAFNILVGSVAVFSIMILRAIAHMYSIKKVLKQLQFSFAYAFTGPAAWIAAITAALAFLAIKIANAKGEMDQLVRSVETFVQDGDITRNTIKGLIDTTQEFEKALRGYNEEARKTIKENLINNLTGTPEERQAYIDSIEQVIDKNEDLINVTNGLLKHAFGRDMREAVRNGTMDYEEFVAEMERINNLSIASPFRNMSEESSQMLFQAFKMSNYRGYLQEQENNLRNQNRLLEDELGIAKDLTKALEIYEKNRDEKIRNDAIEALGIDKLAEEGTHFRYVQEEQIKAYIENNKQHDEAAKKYQEEREAILELDTVYSTITDNIKKNTDSFVASLEALPEATAMTADEMLKNFKERFAIAQIFKDQMKQLEDAGYDDLGLLVSSLGPEFAPSLANLLKDPEVMNAIEAGLEAQRITASENLKENTAKVINTYGDTYAKLGKDLASNMMQGAIDGLEAEEEEYYKTIDKIISNGITVANLAAGNKSPSWKTARISKFMILGFVKGIKDNYPQLETTWKETVIDLVTVIEQSVGDAMNRINTVFGTQFGLFGAQNNLIQNEQKYNELLEKRNVLLKGNTAEQIISIREAQDKVDFLRIAYKEGTISAEELAIAEQELTDAQNARQKELDEINRQVEQSELQQAQALLNLAQQAYQILQLGPEGLNQFKEIADVLGVDSQLIDRVSTKTSELANTIGTKFGGVVDDMAKNYFDTNLKIEQEKIDIEVDTTQADNAFKKLINDYAIAKDFIEGNSAKPNFTVPGLEMYAKGGRIPMYANGGKLRGGYGLVGEYGPELIRAIPGGGVDITPLGNTGNSSITVQNLNVNVTGVPSDPGQARKAAIEIKKALHKLDREGLIGTGIRGR